MSLREYTRKRRLDVTPEPAADARGKSRLHPVRPIFVVQLHHARARHYDFRLEMDGVLKSWAVPKGPSLRVGVKRLAVEVEDHPLAYAAFEGDIPKGHYGAGHVDVFDHGVWNCEGDPLLAWAEGKIEFVLHGEKLKGAWKLIRTGKQVEKPQWLLLKREDEFAADAEADDLVAANDESSGLPVEDKVRGKSAQGRPAKAARPGAKARSWQRQAMALEGAKLAEGHEPLAPQLASLREAPPAGDSWVHEMKWDGYRLLADLHEGRASLRSRNGLDWSTDFPEIVAALEHLGLDDAALDGELIALDEQGRDDFALLQRSLEGSATAPLRYVVFDLLRLQGVDLGRVRLIERKALLERLLATSEADILAYSHHLHGHATELLAASREQGAEGIVSKSVDAPYTPGRSTTWLKIKHAQTDEFVIVGYTAPKGSRTGFGSLLVATVGDGKLTYAGRVGTGFDDAALRRILTRLEPMRRERATLTLPAHVPFSAGAVSWVEPQLLAEVAYRGRGTEGLLRQASFLRLREDKSVKDIDDQATSKNKGAARLSNPDKLVYPQAGISKGQVADYYRAVAAHMLPELSRRPLSLLRCPAGIEGTCFFQKHHAGSLGEGVRAVEIRSVEARDDEYLYIEDERGLLDLVQMNTLEFHPWGAHVDDIEHPDRLVFDLDPGEGVEWKRMIHAARDIRDHLQQANLQSFLRLSGGKGLHVVVPIRPGADWPEAKDFCEAFALTMAAQAPDRYVATAAKAKRTGVIFIDWLRNTRGATSVASWSLRAREGVGVAMPLRWEELGRTHSGAEYDLQRALGRASRLRKDPWQGWQQAIKQPLPRLG